jgi:hypothetical protein
MVSESTTTAFSPSLKLEKVLSVVFAVRRTGEQPAFAGRTFMNMSQLAHTLGINVKTIARLMDAGDLPYTEVGLRRSDRAACAH